MSIGISIQHARKAYGEKIIIPDLSLEVNRGEFFTLLGPSGCGKTTLLRMIAGFNTIEGGDFYFDEKRINDLDPSKRNIGMVFQNYAIFPNMTVRKNVEFGLSTRRLNRKEIRERTDEFMRLMHIEEYAERRPDRLSGGQQQRVALARALVISPDILLMDEPLSNLDAKLRVEMRSVIKSVQRSVGITTIYVTHDQEEAMAVSDRIAVMKDGVIQHVGTPKEIYQRPKNIFVATFIGRSNLIRAEAKSDGSSNWLVFSNGHRLKIDTLSGGACPKKVIVCVRPEEFKVSKSGEGLKGTVTDSIFLGLNTHYSVKLETGDEIEVIQESTMSEILPTGSEVTLAMNASKINVFSDDGACNLCRSASERGSDER